MMAGCASAVAVGQNTALDSTDLITMTDDMAVRILASPAVQQAIKREGSLKVVVEPLVNDMRAEVLPPGPADAFTARLRTLLARHAPGQFTWIMNREAFYALRNQELADVNLGPSPDAISPGYALTATFTSLANENESSRTDYYVCTYSLIDLTTRAVLWTGDYEVKKQAVKGFLD
jgi:PBP1b-binding outer membrane lipoprotein LpoB